MSDNAYRHGDNSRHGPATHLGRQMRRDRVAHGWSLREMHRRTGFQPGNLSAVENGKRPFSERLAVKCDEVFPERRGWYQQEYEESKSWIPAGLRDWSEYEDKAAVIRSWSPNVLDGLVQTEGYARALIETSIGATAEMTSERLRERMERQRRIMYRDDPPMITFVVDEPSLTRLIGTPEVMTAQMRHLARIARLPHVTVQLLPPVGHPVSQSGLVVTDSAAYAEHVFAGYTYSDTETVTSALRMITKLAAESDKASASLAKIERTAEQWEAASQTGVSPATAVPTAGSA